MARGYCHVDGTGKSVLYAADGQLYVSAPRSAKPGWYRCEFTVHADSVGVVLTKPIEPLAEAERIENLLSVKPQRGATHKKMSGLQGQARDTVRRHQARWAKILRAGALKPNRKRASRKRTSRKKRS